MSLCTANSYNKQIYTVPEMKIERLKGERILEEYVQLQEDMLHLLVHDQKTWGKVK